MNIYIDGIIYSLQKNGGGITRYTDELISGLIKNNHKVNLIIHKRTCDKKIFDKKINVININSIFTTKNRILKFFTFPFHRYKVNNYLKNIDNGIIHSTYSTYYNNLKIPHIVTIHDLIREKLPNYFNKLSDKIFIKSNKKAIEKSSLIISVSEQTKNDLISYYNVNSEKIHTTHLGVNTIFEFKNQKDTDYFKIKNNINYQYILYIGSRSLYKNFNKFIEAYSKWNHKNEIKVIVVGGGKFTKNETLMIKNLKLEKFIFNFNYVSENDLIMFYNSAKIFVFPTLMEGFGLPIIEAMACGTQIICSDIPIFNEIAGDVPNYFNPKDINSIISAMDKSLIQNKNKILEGLNKSHLFKWENTVNETIDIYKIAEKSYTKSFLV